MNLVLMKLMHNGLSKHQFYNYDRILKWKQAGTLQEMYESNQWVINQLTKYLKFTEIMNNNNGIFQMRVYQLNESNKEQFLNRFRNHASRIMKRYGFNILNMWETNHNGEPEFVYLLQWENEEALKHGWEKFFADEEWILIKDETNRKYGKLVGERIEDRILKMV